MLFEPRWKCRKPGTLYGNFMVLLDLLVARHASWRPEKLDRVYPL